MGGSLYPPSSTKVIHFIEEYQKLLNEDLALHETHQPRHILVSVQERDEDLDFFTFRILKNRPFNNRRDLEIIWQCFDSLHAFMMITSKADDSKKKKEIMSHLCFGTSADIVEIYCAQSSSSPSNNGVGEGDPGNEVKDASTRISEKLERFVSTAQSRYREEAQIVPTKDQFFPEPHKRD